MCSPKLGHYKTLVTWPLANQITAQSHRSYSSTGRCCWCVRPSLATTRKTIVTWPLANQTTEQNHRSYSSTGRWYSTIGVFAQAWPPQECAQNYTRQDVQTLHLRFIMLHKASWLPKLMYKAVNYCTLWGESEQAWHMQRLTKLEIYVM